MNILHHRDFYILAAALLLSAGLFPTSAGANIYDFSIVAGNVSGSGTFTTTGASSPFTVTDASGTITDTDISANPLTITGVSTYAGADNLLYFPSSLFVDFSGISVHTASSDFNWASSGGQDGVVISKFNVGFPNVPPPGFYAATSFSVTPAAAVPGPVVGAGLPGLIFAGAGLLGWWRRKRKAVAAA